MITIFTPAYNRANKLFKLFESLNNQTVINFEWVIVNDGSQDETEEVVKKFVSETKFKVNYIFQKNAGKHVAINRGVEAAKGDLFFIVDSDDYLPNNAIEIILNKYDIQKNQIHFGGVAGRKTYFDGKMVGSNSRFEDIFSNAIDIRFKKSLQGDLAEVFLTKVLKEYPFPEIENEKFCPEALVWNRIAQKYKLLYFNENIYHCEYLPDGLTAKIVKIRMTSPKASMLTYSELESYKIPLKEKIKANINFWRFSFNSSQAFFKKCKYVNLFFSFIGLPIGFLMYLKDKNNNKDV